MTEVKISDEVFKDICNQAKIELDIVVDKAHVERAVNSIISSICDVELDCILEQYGDLCLYNDFDMHSAVRDDVPRQSLTRIEVLATAKHHEMGCINIPVSLREG